MSFLRRVSGLLLISLALSQAPAQTQAADAGRTLSYPFRKFWELFKSEEPQAPPPAPTSFSVLTYNTALLRFRKGLLKKDFDEEIDLRTELIPHFTAQTGADILLLQEVWDAKSRDRMIVLFRALGYRYSAYDDSDQYLLPLRGAFRNGLLTVSRFPITGKTFKVYKGSTRFKEYLVAKGILTTDVFVPLLEKWIQVSNTHLGALSLDKRHVTQFDSGSLEDHQKQIEQLVSRITAIKSSRTQVISGDFNQHFYEWNGTEFADRYTQFYCAMTGHCEFKTRQDLAGLGLSPLKLVDTFVESQASKYDFKNPVFTYPEQNPSLPKLVLDYIFMDYNNDFKPVRSRVLFDGALDPAATERWAQGVKHDHLPLRLSDHYAVMTTFEKR